VACHAYSGIGLQRALDGGCDSIEHGLSLTDTVIAQMIKQGTWYCPTICAVLRRLGRGEYAGRKARRKRASEHEISVQKAAKAGVKTVFGTDHRRNSVDGTDGAGIRIHGEVRITTMGTIQAATSRAAEMLDMKGEIGVIATGAFADIVAEAGIVARYQRIKKCAL